MKTLYKKKSKLCILYRYCEASGPGAWEKININNRELEHVEDFMHEFHDNYDHNCRELCRGIEYYVVEPNLADEIISQFLYYHNFKLAVYGLDHSVYLTAHRKVIANGINR